MTWNMTAPAVAAKPPPQPAIPIAIGGGTADSAAFRWSSALSEILSRPPGLPDCDPGAPCGVPGVIASAQTYDDSAALLTALLDGRIATAIVPAIPIHDAVCPPGKGQPAPLTILKLLYRQPLYIVVRAGPKPVARPAEWAGKGVAVGPAGSDSDRIATALLDAYGVRRTKVRLLRLPPAQAVAALKAGTVPVALFIGHVFDSAIADLVGYGFTLMPLPQSPERDRLLKALPVLEPSAIPPGVLPGLAATSAVAQPVAWVAGSTLNPALARKLISAVSEPRNLARIEERVDPVPPVPEGEAFQNLPGPPSPGAEAFAQSAHRPLSMVACPPAPR
jgi:TRAP-type uncharacterized transport system substrate-binding protein